MKIIVTGAGLSGSVAAVLLKRAGHEVEIYETRPHIAGNCHDGKVDGVTIHSVRLPGFVADQEVIFGMAGQTLHIKHNTINRECFMPGVTLAIKEVMKRPGLTVGLEPLLNLQEA